MGRPLGPAAALGAVLALALTGCGSPDPEQGLVVAEGVTPRVVQVADAPATAAFVSATREVGAALLATAPAGENAVVSPSSLAVALSMLADGARGETLDELERVLAATGDERRAAVAALRTVLLPYDGDPALVRAKELPETPMVHLATQAVVDDDFTPDDAYLTTLAQWYGAGLQHTDLATDAGTEVLSAWVRHHSGGLVERTAIQPTDGLRLVLQDAVVLAAAWETPFPAHATAELPFTLADGSQVTVPTMSGAFSVPYAEVDGWRAARLPYTQGGLHADLVLPPPGTDPAHADPAVLAELAAALDDADARQVRVSLPRLDLKPDPLDLRAAIDALGAPTVLDPAAADLSAMGTSADGAPLYLAQAMQQTVLQVQEDGTRAAAVTELGIEAGSAPADPVVELTLDRPFLVQIAHTTTGWPLFEAAVRNPAQ
jgi:serpin B